LRSEPLVVSTVARARSTRSRHDQTLARQSCSRPLEGYYAQFDDLFDALVGRQAFRRYLEGLLLPTERNKTLTALAKAPNPLWGTA